MDNVMIGIYVVIALVVLHIISRMISTVSHVYRFFHLGVRGIYFLVHWIKKLRTKE